MKTGIKQRLLGSLLLIVLVLGCRSSQPPKIEICILDGFGAGDCIEADGSRKYRLPSEMKNYWSTNQADMSNFSSWCYDASQTNTNVVMQQITEEVRK